MSIRLPAALICIFASAHFCARPLIAEDSAPVAPPNPAVTTVPAAPATTAPPAPAVVSQTLSTVRPLSKRELGEYQLVFSDEFDGDKLDTTVWDCRGDTRYWSVQKAENVTVSGGYLHLALKKEKAGKSDYTGAGVICTRKFKYGYYEASIKCPAGKGWHTSFYLTAHKTEVIGARQEADVFETDSIDPKSFTVNLHEWKPMHRAQGVKKIKTPDLTQDFHVWGCEFTPQKVRYFFDGELVATMDDTEFIHDNQTFWISSFAAPLAKTDHVDDSKLPGEVLVDWVRFYEKKH